MVSAIPSASPNKGPDGKSVWEKQQVDVNNIDESFANARDIGMLRLNYSRLNAISELGKYNSTDTYSAKVLSGGKMKISLKSGGEKEKVLNFAAYDQKYAELQKSIDPEGYAKAQVEGMEKSKNLNYLEADAPELRLKVYMTKGNKQVLVADSHAEKGSKEREAAEAMLDGSYRTQKGDYYVQVEKNDSADAKANVPYVLQMQVGDKYQHDYVTKQSASTDTKAKKISTKPASSGGLSQADILQMQSATNQGTANMLSVGYLNIADIYNKNSKLK